MDISLKLLSRARAIRNQESIHLAALTNEQLTRERVEAFEAWAQQWSTMGLWGRLRWLVLGR